MTLGINTAVRNARLDAITTQVGTSGILRIYSGTRPATAGTATTLLAQLTFNASAFAAAASAGVLTLNAITGANASSTGTASWFRILKSDATTICIDGDVSTTGSDLNMTSTAFTSGQPVAVSSWTITEGNA